MKSLKNLYRIGYGPSSSHTMGPGYCSQFLKDTYPDVDKYIVTLYGSLALTGKGHLTDLIIKKILKDKVKVIFDYKSKQEHPNTLIGEVYKDGTLLNKHTFVSLGGGTISIDGKICFEPEVYPFKNFQEIKEYALKNNITLDQVVDRFEEVDEYLNQVFLTMEKAIVRGLNTEGYLPGELKVRRKASIIFHNDTPVEKRIHLISSYAYASSEENASGNKIVTAPTCGSCGVLPAALYYYYHDLSYPLEKIIKALKVASLIGNVIKQNASISGALAGCQSEIGSACSMTAAAISYLEGLNINNIEYAAEVAMEHHLGLTCDPIKGYVQIPCIERNAVCVLRAFDSCYLASILTDLSKVSFDTVVKTMYQTGLDLSSSYKETSKGGLAKFYSKNEK